MKTFDKPVRTEIIDTAGNEITFLGETEKAYLVVLSRMVRRGTSMVRDELEREQWIPKSVWNNDKNFEEDYKGQIIFKTPYFLR